MFGKFKVLFWVGNFFFTKKTDFLRLYSKVRSSSSVLEYVRRFDFRFRKMKRRFRKFEVQTVRYSESSGSTQH